MLDVKEIEKGGLVYHNTAKLVLGDNVYKMAVAVFNTGDYHLEINGDLIEQYDPISTLDEIVDIAWADLVELAHEDAQNKAFASELYDEENN